MAIGWIPKTDILAAQIQEEITKLQAKRRPQFTLPRLTPPSDEPVIPAMPDWTQPQQTAMPSWAQTFQAPAPQPMVEPRQIAQPVVPKVEETKPEGVPFWQRALQVFTAPFDWVDENIIKPGLSTIGTTTGIVPEAERQPGEDYWKWKLRSWEAWETPGTDVKVPWSDKPLRLDVKGIISIAPWLLIPGAGTVGGGVRGGVGVAGMLGKLGKAGRVLGTAVEYSPWGLVEKTAGVALKGAAKGVGKVTGGVSTRTGERLFGKIPEPPPMTAVESKMSNYLKEVIAQRKLFRKDVPAMRAKQLEAIEKVKGRLERGEITPSQATDLMNEARKVSGIRAGFAIKGSQVTKTDIDEFLAPIYKSTENGFVQADTAVALQNTLMGVDLLEPHHITAISRIYGKSFANSIRELTLKPRSTVERTVDALNLPRAVLASGDLSGTFRQGLILGLTHPGKFPRAFARQLKAFASEKLTLDMDDALRNHKLYKNAVEDGVEFTALERGAQIAAKEEPFASNLAQAVPFVRRSERAFTTFLNEMRMGTYEVSRNAMVAQGATVAQLKLMGNFINLASGRGTLPANLNRYAPMFNTVLFSARYQMSTLQLPRQIGRMLLSKNPYMRKEAAKALVTFVGGGAALVSLLQATGRGKVEVDPRSGDFGKVIIGKTRLDIWRGYVQYARFVAQMLTGERKSAYGNMNKEQRDEIAFRFLQSKTAPAFGLMVDLLKGESYMGEPLFNETTGFIKMARDRLLPLALQDVMDAMEQSGTNGLWTAAPATLGIGVLTYVNDFVRVKEKIAREAGYESWDDIDPKTQKEMENTNTELQVASLEFDRQVMGTAWGDWRNAGVAVEDVFKENIDNAVAQYRATGDGYTFREKVNGAFTARRGGYAARSKEERFGEIVNRLNTQDTTEALVGLGPEQMAIRIYNDALYGDDMYDEFGDYKFDQVDAIRQALKGQLGAEMFDYVEEYRGMKYGDLPPEYQELVKAKQILKPYWQVISDVEKILGKPKNKYQQVKFDRIVARIHKQKKAASPEMAQAYAMFYQRQV